jgi:hypothetical protein
MGEAKRRKLAGQYAVATAEPTAVVAAFDEHPSWPLSNREVQGRLEGKFTALGVDPYKPGFHDSQPFLAAERRDRHIMDDYARLVEARTYSEQELLEAQRKIIAASKAVADAAAADGRKGLCVVASGILSRMRQRHPDMFATLTALPGRTAQYPGGELRYVVTAVGGYQEPLRELHGNASLAGLTPAQLFDKRVTPMLES